MTSSSSRRTLTNRTTSLQRGDRSLHIGRWFRVQHRVSWRMNLRTGLKLVLNKPVDGPLLAGPYRDTRKSTMQLNHVHSRSVSFNCSAHSPSERVYGNVSTAYLKDQNRVLLRTAVKFKIK